MPNPNTMAKETTPVAPQETINDEKKEDKVETTTPPASEGKDYKAELEKLEGNNLKLSNKSEQAGHVIEDVKRENKTLKNTEDIDIEAIVEKAVEKGVEKSREEMAKDSLEDSLQAITDNDDERALIEHHYNNTIQKSGLSRSQIKTDLERARLLANQSIIETENTEMKESLKSVGTIKNSGVGSSQGKNYETPIKLTTEEKDTFDRMNLRREKNGNPKLTEKEFKAKVSEAKETRV